MKSVEKFIVSNRLKKQKIFYKKVELSKNGSVRYVPTLSLKVEGFLEGSYDILSNLRPQSYPFGT